MPSAVSARKAQLRFTSGAGSLPMGVPRPASHSQEYLCEQKSGLFKQQSYQVLEGAEEWGRELALPLSLGQEKGQGDLLWPLVYVVS